MLSPHSVRSARSSASPASACSQHERARPQAPVDSRRVHRPPGQCEHARHQVAPVVLEQQVQGERVRGEPADDDVVLLEEAAVQHVAVETDLGADQDQRAERDPLAPQPGGEAGPAASGGLDGPVLDLGHLRLPLPGR